MNIRPAAVAGTFYPADAGVLTGIVDRLLGAAKTAAAKSVPALKALIVPHAGYIYSGPVAAFGYARLRPFADAIRRVVLLGPAHRVHIRGLALPNVQRFATPLGDVEIDAEATAAGKINRCTMSKGCTPNSLSFQPVNTATILRSGKTNMNCPPRPAA